MDTSHMVYRTVYVAPDVDAALRAQADQERVAKGIFFRRYLETGMQLTTERRRLPQPVATVFATGHESLCGAEVSTLK
jgi:hypothetical protein